MRFIGSKCNFLFEHDLSESPSPPRVKPGADSFGIMLLVRKSEVHDVAVCDDIGLALEPHLAGRLRASLAAQTDIVVVGNGLRADEPALEIGVDHARRL